MNYPPPIIDSAKLLYFATNDSAVTFTGKITLYVGSELLGEVPLIAICKPYNEVCEVFIYFCNENWETLGCIGCASVEEAKQKVEVGYNGISKQWQEANFSQSQVNEYLSETYGVDPASKWWETRCSFCNKESAEVENMFSSENAIICNECIIYLHSKLNA
jgi:hypothetical protein